MKKAVAAAVCAVFLCSCAKSETTQRAGFFGFDTYISAEISAEAPDALSQIKNVCENLDLELSPYKVSSAVSRFNGGERSGNALISEICLEYSKAAELLGNGVTPYLGSVTLLWNISSEAPRVPSDDEILEKLTFVRTADIVPEEIPNGTLLDFGAAAKGFFCDKALEILENSGVSEGKISAGSSTLVYSKSEDRRFTAAVRNPFGEGEACLFETGNSFISTAGGYERYFEADGVRYSHIFDMNTGRPAETDIASATVVLPAEQGCGALSDIASTLIYLGGTERISEYADKLNTRFDGDFAIIVISEKGEMISAGNANILSVSERSENER
ncbi:MAG: FAD:protein FMN transferase [Oscillospiraceae bacterium]|nr:FAD:protein FMN transferase [Oscillospiraceae bacterium]